MYAVELNSDEAKSETVWRQQQSRAVTQQENGRRWGENEEKKSKLQPDGRKPLTFSTQTIME